MDEKTDGHWWFEMFTDDQAAQILERVVTDGWEYSSVLECMRSKCKALGLIPVPKKKCKEKLNPCIIFCLSVIPHCPSRITSSNTIYVQSPSFCQPGKDNHQRSMQVNPNKEQSGDFYLVEYTDTDCIKLGMPFVYWGEFYYL